MEVILREDIPKLGNKGEVVKVKNGYARNYLLPRRLAILSTPGTRKQIDAMRDAAERKAAREKGSAEALASQLGQLELTFTKRSGDHGQLFGSVTSANLVEAVAEKGFTIDRKQIELGEPLKKLGEFAVPVRLHRDVIAGLKVKVLSEAGEEAPPPPEVAAPAEEVEAAKAAVAEAEGEGSTDTAPEAGISAFDEPKTDSGAKGEEEAQAETESKE